MVRIFPHLDWVRRDTEHLSVSSPNTGKYGPEKTPYLDTFQVAIINIFYLQADLAFMNNKVLS